MIERNGKNIIESKKLNEKIIDHDLKLDDFSMNKKQDKQKLASSVIEKQVRNVFSFENSSENNQLLVSLNDIKSNLLKVSNKNIKIPSKLPVIESKKTIIGFNFKQVIDSNILDVKIKTLILSSGKYKYLQIIINALMKYSDDFDHHEKKKKFFYLCISVAIDESIGFKKTTSVYPEINQIIDYQEFKFRNTKTKYTPSNKKIHKNDFDYSIFFYIGHILIWALYQKIIKDMKCFMESYDLPFTSSMIVKSLGGRHLWDKLINESNNINLKRWKHIIKFRKTFPCVEDLFFLILKLFKIDNELL